MSYDRKCWILACSFLKDEHDLNLDKRNHDSLAQAIQETIEEWISEHRKEEEP